MKKPPVGLEPRYIYESIRITQIADAIRRYLDADKDIPVEWIEEYNDLQSRQIHVIPLAKCKHGNVWKECPECNDVWPTARMSAAFTKFDDPPPRPGRCYICGYYHLPDKPCPDGTK